jgi:uncharacterized protein (AIM24 family)
MSFLKMKKWHYHTPSGSNGSIEEENLNELVQNGTLKSNTFVWCSGMTEWEPAGKVLPALFNNDTAPPAFPQKSPGKRSHEIDFKILGESIQMVEIELDPQETVIAEAGAMNYMEDGITFETKMGDGSAPDTGFMGKLMQVGKRALTGESLFMTHFTNRGTGKKTVAFAAPYPGTIVAADLSQCGGELLCQRDAFLCAAMGTQVGIALNKKMGAGFFGGEGFILQRLNGDGLAFLHAGGMVIRKELKLGHRSNDTCQISLDNLEVPASALLGQLGDGLKIALSGLEAKRVIVAAQAVGLAQAAFDAALYAFLASFFSERSTATAGSSVGDGMLLA